MKNGVGNLKKKKKMDPWIHQYRSKKTQKWKKKKVVSMFESITVLEHN